MSIKKLFLAIQGRSSSSNAPVDVSDGVEAPTLAAAMPPSLKKKLNKRSAAPPARAAATAASGKRAKPQSRRNVGPGKQYATWADYEKDLKAWVKEEADEKKKAKDHEQAIARHEEAKREGKKVDECPMGGRCNHEMCGNDGSGHPTHTTCQKCGRTCRA